MAGIINRALSALNPWYNWGTVNIERMNMPGTDGDARFFDLQWLGLHFSIWAGRVPRKPTPAEIAARAAGRAEYEAAGNMRRERRQAWNTAHQAYLTARAYFEAIPIGTPSEDAALDVWVEAMNHLIENVPSPDGEALAIKIELAASREIELYDEWVAALAADARRLHAEGF